MIHMYIYVLLKGDHYKRIPVKFSFIFRFSKLFIPLLQTTTVNPQMG